MARHPSLVPRKTKPLILYFPRRNEKTATEDFIKTMRLRDNNKTSYNNIRDKVLRHYNIINSHQLY
jgi:hypothetical protein